MEMERSPYDCGAHGCRCASTNEGQRTNGGCRCTDHTQRLALIWWKRQALALLDQAPTVEGEHRVEWCEACQCATVICGACGNNSCNGSHGEFEGKPCPRCESAYRLMVAIEVVREKEVLAEREACAQIADDERCGQHLEGCKLHEANNVACKAIAAAIRSRTPKPKEQQ